MSTVSIVMPAFNEEAYISQSIASVQNQSHKDWELIVVDDGSTDKTFSIVRDFQREDSRVRALQIPHSGMAAVARNEGIRCANGEYLAFLDADDSFFPEKVERQLSIMERFSYTLSFHDVSLIDEQDCWLEGTHLGNIDFFQKAQPYLKKISPNVYQSRPEFFNFISLFSVGFSTRAVMLRRALLDRQSEWFSEELMIGEDIDLWLRLAQKTECLFINEPLAYYRKHEGNLTGDKIKRLTGGIEAYSRNYWRARKQFPWFVKMRYRWKIARELRFLGYRRAKKGENSLAREAYLKSLYWAPSWGGMIGFLKTFGYNQAVFVIRSQLKV